MSTLAVETSPVTLAQLAAILGDDATLIAARRLLAAKKKRQALYGVSREDQYNSQPWLRAMHEANTNAQEAVRALADAADRAAERLVREESV